MSQRVQALEAAVSEARDAAARGMERARAEVQAELEDARAAEVCLAAQCRDARSSAAQTRPRTFSQEEAEAARAEAEEAQDRVCTHACSMC